jgi:cellulose synthase/poly-beta-1,6-N-acetylglucosamine synthase-like glycosyltransferase
MPARVLQSMKQTYKNFEIWISDGSDKEECKKELDAFCKEHKINLFRLGGSGSKNKADNTNKFLKYSGVDFDYLLITDADAVVHKNFVETSVKMFLSKKFPRLA